MKKILLALSALFLFSCSYSLSNQPLNETLDSPSELEYIENRLKKHKKLSPSQMKGMEFFSEIDNQLAYAEHDRYGNITKSISSSIDEVIEMIHSISDTFDYHLTKDSEDQLTIIFHDTDSNTSTSKHQTNIHFNFIDKQLSSSNIIFDHEIISNHEFPSAIEINSVQNIKEIIDDNKQTVILSIAKLNLEQQTLLQLMIPSTHEDEEISHYVYFIDEQFVFSNFLQFNPYKESSENLNIGSHQSFQGLFDEIKQDEKQEFIENIEI